VGIDWGNVPAWVGAVLTGSSFLIAANAYRQSVAERIQRQARQVTAWVVVAGDTVDGGAPLGQDLLCVRNGSDAAAYFVIVNHGDGQRPDRLGVSAWRSIGPETTVTAASLVAPGDLLPATLSFIDAGGQAWSRGRLGQLSRPARRRRGEVTASLEAYFRVDEQLSLPAAVGMNGETANPQGPKD